MRGAMAISNPWCISVSTTSLEKSHNKYIYNSALVDRMKDMVEMNQALFKPIPNIKLEKVSQATTIKEFDEAFTCPLFGYKCVEDYYFGLERFTHFAYFFNICMHIYIYMYYIIYY